MGFSDESQWPKLSVRLLLIDKLREFVVVGIMWVPAEMQKLLATCSVLSRLIGKAFRIFLQSWKVLLIEIEKRKDGKFPMF